jgi:uncharacterized protein with PIN domain
MTDDLRDRLAAAIDHAAAPVSPSEAMLRGRRQARRRSIVAVGATVIAVAVSGVAIASATTRNASRPARVFVGDRPDASSTSVATPAYQASETLVILLPAVANSPGHVRGASISPVDVRNVLVALITGEDTARAVAEAGGLAQFTVVGLPEASPLIKVVTTSQQRQDANRTLLLVDSLIKQKLLTVQTSAGTQARDLLTSELVTRQDA